MIDINDYWPWIITGFLLAIWIVCYMLFILPIVKTAYPGDSCAHWGISIGANAGFLILCLFLI